MLPPFPEPPTKHSLIEARERLEQNTEIYDSLSAKIAQAEQDLTRTVREAESAIAAMRDEKLALQRVIHHTQAYLSPIRRIPPELLREVFHRCFEDNPLCAWGLASVDTMWRNLVLAMPRLWSKVRLHATPNQAPETVRLWLQRAGPTIPLDIEIYLHVKKPSLISDTSPSRTRNGFASPPESLYGVPGYFSGSSTLTTGPSYILTTHAGPLPPTSAPFILPSSTSSPDIWAPASPPSIPASRPGRTTRGESSTPWGFVAIYYLVEQMHRWQRFVFKFDRQFSSTAALKSITGPAPMLKEFEISALEPALYPDWNWLPTTSTPAQPAPNLESLTLQHVPFTWSAPIFHNHLRNLTLRSLHSSLLPLNQIVFVLRETSDTLESASLHFHNVLNPVIPLSSLTLPHVKTFSIGGHYLLTTLVEHLVLPEAEELNFDIEARDNIEDSLHTLTANSPGLASGLKHLSIAYGHGWSLSADSTHSSYYHGSVLNWQFLTELSALESLRVGGCHVELLLNALSHPDEEVGTGAIVIGGSNGWVCPQLHTLGLKNCTGHTDAWTKTVQDTWGKLVQAIENRTASTPFGGVKPVQIKTLELLESQGLGVDVVNWLNKKCSVTWTEFERQRYYVD